MNKQIKHVPMLALRGITVFPGMAIHFDVGRSKSLKAIEEAMAKDEMLLVVAQKDASVDEPEQEDLYEIGTLVHIKQVANLKESAVRVLVKGEQRAKIISLENEPFMYASIEVMTEEEQPADMEQEAMLRTIGELFEKYAAMSARISEEMVQGILSINNMVEIVDIIIANMTLEVEKKQEILGCFDIKDRMYQVIKILDAEIQILTVQKNIYAKVKKSIDQSQKEYFLREQIKVIQEELGEKDGVLEDIASYEKKLEALNLPEEVRLKMQKEIRRLNKVSSASPESGTIRTYIDTVLDLPWGIKTNENIDLKQAHIILEREHYGLTKIKERVLEYLAVKKMSHQVETPILCLVGPPGVGKTSIARSIAQAIGRNYVRISLGGIRDESEIRGHRRTYVGAIPGRFVYGLTQAKSMNPLILLDEVDKMMGDFRGDPAAALLEVLDSNQNSNFRDNYLEVPLDLSESMFIATANSLASIPKPLLDRMEIIDINSYTGNEKLYISKKHLMPKQLKRHELTTKNLKMNETSLNYIIEHYTKEAGVRSLERMLAKVCRRAVKEMIERDVKSIRITPNKLNEYLGIPRYLYEKKNEEPEIGVVRGLAWTSVGGDTLSIEVNTMPGKGQLQLTGKMGDVMQESAKAALSYIRSKAKTLQIREDFYNTCDIHIHIPEGAVPKDGPSAGITMATAIISALTEKPVKADIAMTGEITIRGRVLAIGGLKEKLIAAKRANINHIIIPKPNERNIKEIEENILENLNIIYASTMDEVLQYVFA
ncbi:endopeptidase La [Cellulosilyticum sp. I15G10I2]|uniref:endopeptidase La n=1 Tax=Cellulosilyticum sp. I15G10I2 TaxID=1892843 RepID=UPI00085BF4D8|nr:endopeptidase La [Cellulosilyticum sp. I15G10I2]